MSYARALNKTRAASIYIHVQCERSIDELALLGNFCGVSGSVTCLPLPARTLDKSYLPPSDPRSMAPLGDVDTEPR